MTAESLRSSGATVERTEGTIISYGHISGGVGSELFFASLRLCDREDFRIFPISDKKNNDCHWDRKTLGAFSINQCLIVIGLVSYLPVRLSSSLVRGVEIFSQLRVFAFFCLVSSQIALV